MSWWVRASIRGERGQRVREAWSVKNWCDNRSKRKIEGKVTMCQEMLTWQTVDL